MFCPKCGSILKPEKKKGKTVMSCSCGYSSKGGQSEIKEVAEETKELEVIEEGADDESLPTTEAECPECGNDEAWYWLKQMRAGDEPETKFHKCTECRHIWREG